MTPEVESHHETHRTGHRWVDFSVAACALLVSFCSVGIAIHHGHTMEKLVQANSLPFLQFNNSNGERKPDGSFVPVLSYEARNAGPGPARIEWFKSFFDDKPLENWQSLLQIAKSELVQHGADSRAVVADQVTTSDVAPYFMKGGDSLNAVRWERNDNNATVWDAVDKIRRADRVHLQACYCSIFDECWIADSKVFKPKTVEHC